MKEAGESLAEKAPELDKRQNGETYFDTDGYRRVNIYNRGYAGNKVMGFSGAFERQVKKISLVFKRCYPDA